MLLSHERVNVEIFISIEWPTKDRSYVSNQDKSILK